jgi:hypothetical protein
MGGMASTGEGWVSFSRAPLPLGRIGSTLTIRVKKGDVDAFAAEKLSSKEFQALATINAYLGNSSGDTVPRSVAF